jgi:hypothetical protein
MSLRRQDNGCTPSDESGTIILLERIYGLLTVTPKGQDVMVSRPDLIALYVMAAMGAITGAAVESQMNQDYSERYGDTA